MKKFGFILLIVSISFIFTGCLEWFSPPLLQSAKVIRIEPNVERVEYESVKIEAKIDSIYITSADFNTTIRYGSIVELFVGFVYPKTGKESILSRIKLSDGTVWEFYPAKHDRFGPFPKITKDIIKRIKKLRESKKS